MFYLGIIQRPRLPERLDYYWDTVRVIPQKLLPPVYLSIEEIEIDGKKVLFIYVPESSQVHRCNGRIYDRNEDGDFDVTDHTVQVANLYQRK